MAVLKGNLKVSRVLAIELSASVNATYNDVFTPLHHAAMEGSADVVQLLLEQGADVDALSLCGRTPLQCATDEYDKHQEYIVDNMLNGHVSEELENMRRCVHLLSTE